MKAKINLKGSELHIEYEHVSLLDDPSIAWTCSNHEFFIRVTSPGPYYNQIWHSFVLLNKTMTVDQFPKGLA